MIEGIQKPDRGNISILGMNWKEHENKLHHLIGLSLQETKFIDKITTEETLNLFGSFYGLDQKRTEELLELTNLQEKRKSYTVNLSGGQRQRIALARALVKDPQVLIFDEATSMYDWEGESDLVDACRDALQGRTIILITHRPASLALADRILCVEDGAVHEAAPGVLAGQKLAMGETQ